jgi:TPP-dependent pyruvate/acetoin dehydrogenase alpha subunit
VAEVLERASAAIDACRSGSGPQCLVCYTYRLAPHSKGDDTRAADELSAAWAKDPLKAARALAGGDPMVTSIEAAVDARVSAARSRAVGAGAAEIGRRVR